MPMDITPELGVPLTPETKVLDLRERAAAACAAMESLNECAEENEKIPTEIGTEDKQIAASLSSSYAADPATTSKQVSTKRASTLPPASLIATRAILDEWGHAVVKHAIEVRHLVTNKLLNEVENPDPRVRIRALELLGKISDVGLFSEKQEITVTHQTTDDLRKKLREKLDKLKDVTPATPEDAEIIDVVEIEGEKVDLNKELGLLEGEFDDD